MPRPPAVAWCLWRSLAPSRSLHFVFQGWRLVEVPNPGPPASSCEAMLGVLSALTQKICCTMPRRGDFWFKDPLQCLQLWHRACVFSLQPLSSCCTMFLQIAGLLKGSHTQDVKAAAMLPSPELAGQAACKWPQSMWWLSLGPA